MKKYFLLLFGLLFSFNIFSQNIEKELIIHNETDVEFLGLYYLPFEPIKDPYITGSGEVNSDYKYKYFLVKSNEDFEKTFTKDYHVKIYMVKDSVYCELIKFKMECSRIIIDMHENYCQIVYKKYNGEVRDQRQYSFKIY